MAGGLTLWPALTSFAASPNTKPLVTELDIVTRDAWSAKPARPKLMRRHEIRGLILHHTSIRRQPKLSIERKMLGLQGFSQRVGKVGSRNKPAWGDVPYHFYIGASGRIAEGRDLAYAGDTNTAYDTDGWIQLVVEGEFTKEAPSARQVESLRRIIKALTAAYNLRPSNITAHDDHAQTNCPGPALKRYLREFKGSPPLPARSPLAKG